MPKISVITTFRNAAPFLGDCLASISGQTCADFEHILVDNGSEDDWRPVFARHADPRQRLVSLCPGESRARALNIALKAAQGEYVAILDADDTCVPRRLAVQAAMLDSRPEVALAASHCRYVDADKRELGVFTPPGDPAEVRHAMAYYNPVAHSSVMYRLALARGGYPEDYPYAHDFAFYLRLLRAGDIVVIPEMLVDIALHEGQVRAQGELEADRLHDELRCLRQSGRQPDLPPDIRGKGRRARMYVGIKHGLALIRAGRGGAGSMRLAKQFLTSPWLFVRAWWVNADLRAALKGAAG